MSLSEMRIPFTTDLSQDAVVYGDRSVFAKVIVVIEAAQED